MKARYLIMPIAFIVAATPSFAIQYTMQTLGTGVGFYSKALGLNDKGEVIGYTYTSTSFSTRGRGFVYSNGKMVDIGVLTGGLFSNPAAINNSSEVVGDASNSGNTSHAFYYYNGVLTDLDKTVGAGFYSLFSGINNLGQIVGGNNVCSFVYSGGTVTKLPISASDISDAGVIVGSSYDIAAKYENGTVTSLGTLGGSKSYAMSVNEKGQIAGYSYTADGNAHSFIYSNGTLSDIGTLPGGSLSYAYSINDSGWVVGNSTYNGTSFLEMHGFVAIGGMMYDLNSIVDSSGSGWNIYSAAEINKYGQIAASAYNPSSGQSMAVLLSPVPEPSTIAVVGAGLLLAAKRRRREQ